MEYRKLPHGDEQISIIGLGNSSLGALGEAEAEKTVAMAVENGINYFDMVGGDATLSPLMAGLFPAAGTKCSFRFILVRITAAGNMAGRWTWTKSSARLTGS